jgi:transposase
MESKFRSGRSCLINNNQRDRLKRLVTNDTTQNWRLCASGVKELWEKKTGQDVSVNTIRRALYSVGLKNCVTRRKPLITPANKAARLA